MAASLPDAQSYGRHQDQRGAERDGRSNSRVTEVEAGRGRDLDLSVSDCRTTDVPALVDEVVRPRIERAEVYSLGRHRVRALVDRVDGPRVERAEVARMRALVDGVDRPRV